MVKLLSVAVSAKVKLMFRASVVVMVLPPPYAFWRVTEVPGQATMLFELSIQMGVPVEDCKPERINVESASKLSVTSLVRLGEKMELPFAFKAFDAVSVPVEVRSLLTVVVPVASPMETAVASPPIFKVVTPELSRLKVAAVEVRSAPLMATSPVNVEVPLPRKEKDGFVVALPKEIFSVPLEVLMLM